MTPNLITLLRVFLALGTIALFQSGHTGSLIALPLLVVTIWLDAVDGYLARRARLTTDIGAAFDIAADRIVESVFWIYFAAAGLISFWIPVIVIARGGFTDFLRMIAFTQGQTAFGEKTMLETWWGRMLVGSRWSRAAYGIVKCAAFFALGVWVVLAKTPEWQTLVAGLMTGVRIAAPGLAIATVIFCVVRGVPVMIEGARYFRKDLALPKAW
ncbi:MAG: CDP-alcohol phosphatidyltransferase family protein [Blastocatellia bacterium]